MLVTATAAILAGTAAAPAPAHAAPALVPVASEAPALAPALPPAATTQEVELQIEEEGRGAWYTNPVWIAIGVIALIVVILLIAMAGRGRDTTVIKDRRGP